MTICLTTIGSFSDATLRIHCQSQPKTWQHVNAPSPYPVICQLQLPYVTEEEVWRRGWARMSNTVPSSFSNPRSGKKSCGGEVEVPHQSAVRGDCLSWPHRWGNPFHCFCIGQPILLHLWFCFWFRKGAQIWRPLMQSPKVLLVRMKVFLLLKRTFFTFNKNLTTFSSLCYPKDKLE